MRDHDDDDQLYEQRREEVDAGERPSLGMSFAEAYERVSAFAVAGKSARDFAADMERVRVQGGPTGQAAQQISASVMALHPTRSQMEWQRRCEASLARSRARRDSPHPWPHGADWRVVLVLFVLTAAALAAGWLLTLGHIV
jgi:hypothetical protein